MEAIKTIGGVKVWQESGALLFKTGATICGDGSPHCYGPDGLGLDYLANAGSPGSWWGIATDKSGEPILQTIYDIAPGYYVSTTALTVPGYTSEFPEHYIDAERYPYIVVPGNFGYGWKTGDVGFCLNESTGDNMYCATCDIGPTNHIGEISMLLGRCLGLDVDPKKGGTDSGIVYWVMPGSDSKYRTWRQKCQIAIDVFTKWGGLSRLKSLSKQL
jgi:uncharacterized protein (DUF779 family)